MRATLAAAPALSTDLEVVHETRYAYAAPVSPALHLACLRPIDDAAQQVLAHTLEIDPAPDERVDERDVYGNCRTRFGLTAAHRELRVVATSRVRLRPRFGALQALQAPAWDTVRDGLRYAAGAAFEPAGEFVHPSPFVPRLPALAQYAAPSFAPGRPLADAAIELMHRLHADFRYEGGSTAIDTPLADAFAQRRGVCQDFAHLLIGALRQLGLPARYVSGYLRTQAPEGAAAVVGADASHAWVQVWSPQTPGVEGDGWLDLDPTNRMVPAAGHVRLAVGRDFGDVTPLRGVIRGSGSHQMVVAVHTRTVGD